MERKIKTLIHVPTYQESKDDEETKEIRDKSKLFVESVDGYEDLFVKIVTLEGPGRGIVVNAEDLISAIKKCTL